MISGQDHNVFDVGLIEIDQVLPNGIGGALIPVTSRGRRFLSREQFDESATEVVELISVVDVVVKAHRHELRQHEDAIDVAVEAV